MKAPKALPRGSQGSAEQLLCQCAQLSAETIEQSCPADARGTTQLRMRLPDRHAKRWLALPLGVREHAAAVVFGLAVDGVDLHELPGMASELREARLTVQNALQLALLHGTPLDVRRVETALDRINHILGGKP